MKRHQGGITLIALIITIIILIILTAITISNVMGNNLFGLAKGAVQNYIDTGKEEEEIINEIINTVGKRGSTTGSVPEEKKIADLVSKEDYGKYVDYGIDIDGVTTEGDFDWKIFYVDKTAKRVFIIAEDYVPNTCEKLVTAATNAKMKPSTSDVHTKYCWYWVDVPEYQPIPTVPDDIEELFWGKAYKVSKHSGLNGTVATDNSKCVSTLLNTENWETFKDSKGYGEYAIGATTIEMWCRSWTEVHPDNPVYANGSDSNKAGYYVGNSEDAITLMYKLTNIDAINDALWFPHYSSGTLIDGTNQCYGYWLASPGGISDLGQQSIRNVDYNGNLGVNGTKSYLMGLRPVICLGSNVTCDWNEDKEVYELSKMTN